MILNQISGYVSEIYHNNNNNKCEHAQKIVYIVCKIMNIVFKEQYINCKKNFPNGTFKSNLLFDMAKHLGIQVHFKIFEKCYNMHYTRG